MEYMKSNCVQGKALAMLYVPWQRWGDIYEPGVALRCGTLFPVLNKPFLGGCR